MLGFPLVGTLAEVPGGRGIAPLRPAEYRVCSMASPAHLGVGRSDGCDGRGLGLAWLGLAWPEVRGAAGALVRVRSARRGERWQRWAVLFFFGGLFFGGFRAGRS